MINSSDDRYRSWRYRAHIALASISIRYGSSIRQQVYDQCAQHQRFLRHGLNIDNTSSIARQCIRTPSGIRGRISHDHQYHYLIAPIPDEMAQILLHAVRTIISPLISVRPHLTVWYETATLCRANLLTFMGLARDDEVNATQSALNGCQPLTLLLHSICITDNGSVLALWHIKGLNVDALRSSLSSVGSSVDIIVYSVLARLIIKRHQIEETIRHEMVHQCRLVMERLPSIIVHCPTLAHLTVKDPISSRGTRIPIMIDRRQSEGHDSNKYWTLLYGMTLITVIYTLHRVAKRSKRAIR